MDRRLLFMLLFTVASLSSARSQSDEVESEDDLMLERDEDLEQYEELESDNDLVDGEATDMEDEEGDEANDEVARHFSWTSSSRQLAALRKDVNYLKVTQNRLIAALAKCNCSNPPPRCPAGYTRYQPRGRFRFCYKAHTSCKGWNAARATCKAEGGDLIVLRDSRDLSYFKSIGKNLFKTGSSSCGHFGFWIGASDQTTEGKFTWVDGKAAKLDKYWGAKQPDNLGNEDCVHVWAAQGYTLNDAWCDGRHVAGFFCSRRQLFKSFYLKG